MPWYWYVGKACHAGHVFVGVCKAATQHYRGKLPPVCSRLFLDETQPEMRIDTKSMGPHTHAMAAANDWWHTSRTQRMAPLVVGAAMRIWN